MKIAIKSFFYNPDHIVYLDMVCVCILVHSDKLRTLWHANYFF